MSSGHISSDNPLPAAAYLNEIIKITEMEKCHGRNKRAA